MLAFAKHIDAGTQDYDSPGNRIQKRILRCVADFAEVPEDAIAIVFCGSKKSLASGLPMGTVLFPAATVGLVVLPLMLFHQMQLMVCAWLARRYGARKDAVALVSA